MAFRMKARKDDNHTDVVALFRKLGWSVLDVSQLKKCCDLVVSKNGNTIAVEIKDGRKTPSQRKLTDGEAKFRDYWQGRWELVESDDDVIKLNASIQSNPL